MPIQKSMLSTYLPQTKGEYWTEFFYLLFIGHIVYVALYQTLESRQNCPKVAVFWLGIYSMYQRNWLSAQKYAIIKKITILTQFLRHLLFQNDRISGLWVKTRMQKINTRLSSNTQSQVRHNTQLQCGEG